jgi:mono/diheme cytochrome c family protein
VSKRLIVAVWLALGSPLVAQELPAGPGQDVAKARCLSCHQADLIQQQRLSKAGWTREVDKMVRWGATVDATDKDPLIDYLTRHFGPAPVPSHEAAGISAGEAVFQRSCLSCHGRDLVEQQRLARPAWVREVDKMIRWGATVPDADKDALVDFLTARHGPTSRAPF